MIGQFLKLVCVPDFVTEKLFFNVIILASAIYMKYLKVLTKVTISGYKALKNK